MKLEVKNIYSVLIKLMVLSKIQNLGVELASKPNPLVSKQSKVAKQESRLFG